MKYPVVAIVGKPNVGKSTIFNRIVGERISIVDDTRGVTRDRLYARTSWMGEEFILIDTGGIEVDESIFSSEVAIQANIAIDEADIIIFVVNVRDGLTSEDHEVATLLYKCNKPIILVANKVDNLEQSKDVYEFYSLGFENVIGVSGAHGIGIGDLLEKAHSFFPKIDYEDIDENSISISFIGRPNVGKSSLINSIIGANRVIVSDVAGTTRDATTTPFLYDEQKYNLIDTAGVRKKGKVYENVEKYSVLRSIDALSKSDVAILVLDAQTGIIEQDKNVVGYAIESGCAILVVVNKWDLVKKDNTSVKEWTENIKSHFPFINYSNIIFVSALTKQRIYKILSEVVYCNENRQRRVSTSVLNNIISDATLLNQAPRHNGGRLKIYYASQVSIAPPTFALFVNDTTYAHFSYIRYIENTIREYFDFSGTPVKFVLRLRK
ncbi:MAG: ribosome biogenesis GTPase Der [Bacilli bacterium]